MTKQLSSAAQTVAWAYDNAPERPVGNHRYHWIAAALRALADCAPTPHQHEEDAFHSGFYAAIGYVLAIATQLEN